MGPLRLQPSEQTKLILVYMLAWYLTAIKERIRKFPYFILAFIIAGVPVALILKQPNLGTAAVLAPIWLPVLAIIGLVSLCRRGGRSAA